MINCWLVRAFVNAEGEHGNPALVVVEPEGASVTAAQRQELANRLGIPATVLVPADRRRLSRTAAAAPATSASA